jgi:hypothetical protein
VSGKYRTAAAFRRAIGRYFDRISYETPLEAEVQTGVTAAGRPVCERVPLTENGRPVRRTRYAMPPTLAGLCLHLGLSRREFLALSVREGFADAAESARTRIEAYLEEELCSRDKTTGVAEYLKLAGRWEPGADAPDAADMSMERREAILRRIAEDFGERDERKD